MESKRAQAYTHASNHGSTPEVEVPGSNPARKSARLSWALGSRWTREPEGMLRGTKGNGTLAAEVTQTTSPPHQLPLGIGAK